MRGRSGQGSDRTGRAHPLTQLRFQMVPVMVLAALVRGSLQEPRLRVEMVNLMLFILIPVHLYNFRLVFLNLLGASRLRSSARSPPTSTTVPLRLSSSGARWLH